MDAYKTKEELDALQLQAEDDKELLDLQRVIQDPGAEAIDLSYQLLRRITSNFSDQIGHGGYGEVYKGLLPNGLCIAVKKLLSSTNVSDESYVDEVTATIRLKHKYLVRLIGYCYETRGKLMKLDGSYVMAEVRERIICLEYVPNGTLQIHTTEFSTLGWGQRFQIVKAICEGLDYMHREACLVHLDLTPNNILLDSNSMPKIFDFGCSRYVGEEDSSIFTDNISGTRGYIAPEMINGREVSFKSDIYSLGLIIIRLFTGLQWIEGYNADKALLRWRKRLEEEGTYSSWEDKCLQVRRCLELGFSCMDTDPHKRPTELRIIQLLDEIGTTHHSVSDGDAPLIPLSGDAQRPPQGTDRPAIIHGSVSKETPCDHLPGDEELGTVKTDAQTSTKKQHAPELATILLPEKFSSLEYLKEITDKFSEKRIIEKSGASGLVYKGIISHEGTVIAVKRFCAVSIPPQNFLLGTQLLMSLDHKNIVKLLGCCQDKSVKEKVVRRRDTNLPFPGPEQLLCYEHMPNGSLQGYLNKGQTSQLDDWQMRYNIIKGTCKGLHYLHEGRDKPIIHLNLNLWNVLLDEKNEPRIADTGVSSLLIGESLNKDMTMSMKSRPTGHIEPEYFSGQGGNLKKPAMADIYSLGVVVLEVVTGKEIQDRRSIDSITGPWTNKTHIESVYASARDPDVLGEIILCIEIGLECVNFDYNERPTAGEIILRLNQGHESVPSTSHQASTSKDIHADDHMRGKEKSSKTKAAVPANEKKLGFFRRHGWGK